jgi:hypothetical protein
MLAERPLQDGDDPPVAERPPDLDRQAFPRGSSTSVRMRIAWPLAQ